MCFILPVSVKTTSTQTLESRAPWRMTLNEPIPGRAAHPRAGKLDRCGSSKEWTQGGLATASPFLLHSGTCPASLSRSPG